jgi:uncharacterized membrane protein YtjA (UPF0391 family)
MAQTFPAKHQLCRGNNLSIDREPPGRNPSKESGHNTPANEFRSYRIFNIRTWKATFNRRKNMLRWAAIFFVIAIIAGLLGFTGVAGAAADIARFLFFLFVAIFVVLFLLAVFAGKKVL